MFRNILKSKKLLLLIVPIFVFAGFACSSDSTDSDKDALTFGMILVGPRDDRGWSQAHFEGGQYIEENLGATMITIDKVNPADSPNVTVPQIVDDMIAQGAQLIFATSDDMKDGILEAAANHPDVPMIWASGDSAWTEGKDYRGDLENLGNVMGQMEYGKMIAGCAAALQSETGKISFLGPLINDETRRLVNSAYLGAKHCWTEIAGKDASSLSFEVVWIGFWFQIPGVTLDPTQVVNEFFDSGSDVVISGIDTPEAIVRAEQIAAGGKTAWAVPYDYENACDLGGSVCLGVPFFNWGPSYLEIAKSVDDDDFEATWTWAAPNWDDLEDTDDGAIGFKKGAGLTDENAKHLDKFISSLEDNDINLWTGPLNYQDGSVFLKDGEEASDLQIWYTPTLLEGIDGASSAD